MSQNIKKYKRERGYKEDSLKGLHSVGPLKVLFPKLRSKISLPDRWSDEDWEHFFNLQGLSQGGRFLNNFNTPIL